MGFSRAQLETFRNATVPDLVSPGCKVLFVGINPGLWTAATQTHFCHPSNRFYPALHEAGLIDWTLDTETGMTDAQRDDFTSRGLGISNLVHRATARASELTRDELRAGSRDLAVVVDEISPEVVAVAGVTAYREAFDERRAALGRQPHDLGPAQLWVVPNPSGLNAHETIRTLAGWYREVGRAAGVS